jgi:hypothetical protein
MTITTGDTAKILYDGSAMFGRVEKINRNADKSIRTVGIVPEGTDHVAWFAPHPRWADMLTSVGGATLAYVARH